jgi:hypothetical protein
MKQTKLDQWLSQAQKPEAQTYGVQPLAPAPAAAAQLCSSYGHCTSASYPGSGCCLRKAHKAVQHVFKRHKVQHY